MRLVNKIKRKEDKKTMNSKDAAKERLHLVLMQDRANVSADFLELMKQEIIEVIKKYIEIDESAIDVRLTNKENSDGTNGAPALYANIPIVNIRDEVRQKSKTNTEIKKNETKLEVDNGDNSSIEQNTNEQKNETENKENETEDKENKIEENIIKDNRPEAHETIETKNETNS